MHHSDDPKYITIYNTLYMVDPISIEIMMVDGRDI
jgi:hypothetical protein